MLGCRRFQMQLVSRPVVSGWVRTVDGIAGGNRDILATIGVKPSERRSQIVAPAVEGDIGQSTALIVSDGNIYR